MRLLTWNINALVGTVRNFVLKHGSFKGFLEAHKLDIMCVQEHKLPEAKLTKDLACIDGFESFWTFSRKKLGYSGCATWTSLEYAARAAEVDCLGSDLDDHYGEGRVVCTDHGHFVLINVYVPNAGGRPDRPRLAAKLAFLQALTAKADGLVAEGREVIIVGDLNVAASQLDCHPQIVHAKCYTREELALLSTLCSRYTDVWRQRHPDTDNVYTVWDEYTCARMRNEGVRIDFVLVSRGLLDKVVSCEVLDTTPPKWSDHAGIIIELEGLEPSPPAAPCALSSRRMKRFNDRSQPSIASLFGKRPAADAAGDGGSSRPAKKAAGPTRAAAAAATAASAAPAEPAAYAASADAQAEALSGHPTAQPAVAQAVPGRDEPAASAPSDAAGDCSSGAEQLGGEAAVAALASDAAAPEPDATGSAPQAEAQPNGERSVMRGGAALGGRARSGAAARPLQKAAVKKADGPSIQSFFKPVAKSGT